MGAFHHVQPRVCRVWAGDDGHASEKRVARRSTVPAAALGAALAVLARNVQLLLHLVRIGKAIVCWCIGSFKILRSVYGKRPLCVQLPAPFDAQRHVPAPRSLLRMSYRED